MSKNYSSFWLLLYVCSKLRHAPQPWLQLGTEHSPNCNTQAGLQEREFWALSRHSPKPAMGTSGSEQRTACVDSMGFNVEPFEPSFGGRFPGRIVESLLAMPDGGLFIGFRNATEVCEVGGVSGEGMLG